VDLCYRVWEAGYPILYDPRPEITHLGGQSVGRFPIRFELEKYRNRYRYFYKHYGEDGARRCRTVSLTSLRLRRFFYGIKSLFKSDEALKNRLEMINVVHEWNRRLDPCEFARTGTEPDLGYEPLMPATPRGCP
jgi:GT2 family glycosyltransferase